MDARLDLAACRDTGTDPTRLERAIDTFGAHLDQGTHPGAQLTVRRHGRVLLEAAGGRMRVDATEPVTRETLFVMFSATKPLTALAIHLLAEHGRLDLDDPVARHWPEFGQRGKDGITIDHVLTHRGAIPHGPSWLSWDRWGDPTAIAEAMERRRPLAPPGEMVAYHPLNFGWVLGELVRRVDGRSLGKFVAEEITGPLGLTDTFIGLPDEHEQRVAHHVDLSGDYDFVADFNRPEVHRAEVGSGGGIATTDDLTRFYSMLLGEGEADGIRVAAPETVRRARAVVVDGAMDQTLGVSVRWARGFRLGGPASPYGERCRPETFGHTGHGSSSAWGDPATGLAFAFFTNGVQRSEVNFRRMSGMADLVFDACPLRTSSGRR